ncbi:PKD domain-containing protein [Chitinophaga nivalis]|uniref:PKD domain-containing protein n=1 Tax=Chitinophaga nivalis TaxID=2991709 RepID=A0ABT3ISJ5_9BACT|nr:PKD domain-containing protein [Chitinophaga nivalis]MCW3463367.1 PKD domain-containing protein [Chitinophaga nivalis]MCW3486943.1 PKD domain-containing protein [Chitinophaga nivalis]
MNHLSSYLWIVFRHAIYCLLLLATLSASAQTVAVSADKTGGCPPFSVQFNAAIDNGYQSIEWDFGVGANVSNTTTPSRIFQTPGTYHVKCTVTYPNMIITRQIDITVYNKPVVKFTTPATTGCIPYATTFRDQSQPGDGSIVSIDWDFGDGSGAIGASVPHTFSQPGTFNVISIVTNSRGCKSNSDPFPLKVQDAPQPAFTADKTESCTAPLAVHFFNTTVNNSTDPITYTWDYGDGTTGTDGIHTYTKTGTYTVTLTATTSGGCKKVLSKPAYIVIQPIKPSFTTSSLCAGQDITFKNTTQPQPDAVTWTFPDGTTATTTDVTRQFPAGGDYLIKMRARLGNCVEETQQLLHLLPAPQINPVASPTTACMVPFTTQFQAQSKDATQWTWNFGDGTTSSLENPTHTYTREGIYDIKLTATNGNGCTKTVNLPGYIRIIKPVLTIQTSAMTGCVPLSVDFKALLNITEPIVSYEWDFGDGSTATDAAPTHIFTKEGTFTVTLRIRTASGCVATATTLIQTGTLPVVDFTATPLISCAKDPIQFTNLSKPRGTSWLWIFPQDNSTSTEENPNHHFGEIGNHDVTLIVTNNGCQAQLTKLKYIRILPPIAHFNTAPDCVDPYHRKFTDGSNFGPDPTLPKSWKWEFGEDGATSTAQHPDFTYKTTGPKVVKLTIDNGFCTSTYTETIQIIDEKPVITADKANICINEKINITLGPLKPENIRTYTWDWGDNFQETLPGNNFNPADGRSHQYSKSGTYTITLTITDMNGCIRTAPSVQVTVNGAVPDFDFTGKRCKDETFTFTDKSTVNSGNQITQWSWDFGDGSPALQYNTPPAVIQHNYTNVNDYTVKLTVTDKFGCTLPIQKVIRFDRVKADFMIPVNIACLNKPFVFSDQSTGTIADYAWDFGDLTTGTGKMPSKTYTSSGTYSITLKVTTSGGCTDAITKTNVIRVPDPKAKFTIPDNLDPCPPVKVAFTNQSTDYERSVWDFGDNGTSSQNDPDEHIYVRSKTYQVTLTVYAEGGCSSSATLPVTIKGPDGSMKSTPTQGCVPLAVTISAEAVKTAQYMWDFDDGVVVTTTTPTAPAHTYTKSGIYYPRVSLIDDQGCSVPAMNKDKIIVDQAIADFTIDNSQACGGGIIRFTNRSKTLTKDSLALDFTNSWDFGVPGDANNHATTPNATFDYTRPGTYRVQLAVTSAYGCISDKILSLAIPPQPEAAISPIAPLCVAGKIQLTGSDNKYVPGTKWQWKVAPNLVYNDPVPPEITLDKSGTYPVSLTITNDDGSCPSTATASMIVHPAPLLQLAPATAKICLGGSLQLHANTTGAVTVQWTDYNISDPASKDPLVKPAVNTVYQVKATNEFGCTNTGNIPVTVVQPFHIYALDAEVCAGKSVQLLAGGALSYRWIAGKGLDRTDIPDPVATPDNTTTYQVVGYDNESCFTDTALAKVHVREAPTVNAGPDMEIPTGTVIPLPVTGSADIIQTTWTPQTGLSCFSCLAPTATPLRNTTYKVTVTNRFGCESSDEISIRLVCTISSLFIPNTFSPNGDGQNDIFYIRGRGMQRIRTFRIFNRWGQLIFERANVNTEDPSQGWDGKFKGTPLNPDVFVYYAEVICDTGESTLLKGNVTLIR